MGILDWITESAKKQYAKGEPYRQALGGLLQGDMNKVNQSLAKSDLTPTDVAMSFAPMGILSVKPVSSYFTENFSEGLGKVISSPHGEIAVLSNSPYSPRTHSVTKFVVDESKRNKGYGKELIDEVLKQYPTDIGAQVSSPASAKAFYKKGFRLASDPNASIDDIFKNIEEYSSAYMIK